MECHPHDLRWVEEQLKQCPPDKRYKLRMAYSEAYAATGNRRECNTRLREYLEALRSVKILGSTHQ